MTLLSLVTLNSSLLASALLAPSGPVPATSTSYAQDKPQEFTFVRPTRAAMGIVVKETHDLTMLSLSTQLGENPPVVTGGTSTGMRTRVDASIAEEIVDVGAEVNGLRRRYLALEGKVQLVDISSVNTENQTFEGLGLELRSPLEGLSVVFQPAASQPDGFGRHFDGVALREAALPSLSAPSDWSRLLPPAPKDSDAVMITLGDSWALDPALLEPLIAPTGALGWRRRKDEGKKAQDPTSDAQVLRAFASGVGGNLHLAFDGEVTGEANAKLVTVGVDPDHGRYGEVSISFALEFAADRQEFLNSRRLGGEGELDVDVVGGDLSVRLNGQATIKWGLDLGRPFAALTVAEEEVSMTVSIRPPSGELASQTIVMKGALQNGLSFRERPLAPVKRTVVEQGK